MKELRLNQLMWKKVLVGIPQGFIKITVIYKKAHRNFHGIPPEFFTEFRQSFPTEFRCAEFRGTRNSVELYSVAKIPRNSVEFFTEFRGILIRRKNFAEFHQIFLTEFLRNSI